MTNRVSEIECRLGPLETRFRAVVDLPQIVKRITVAEKIIADLQSQLSDLTSEGITISQARYQPLLESQATDLAEINYCMGQLKEFKKQQATTSTLNVTVLTALQYEHKTTLRMLAFSVLSTLDPTVLKTDIISVRIIGRLDAAANISSADSKMPPLAVMLSSHDLAPLSRPKLSRASSTQQSSVLCFWGNQRSGNELAHQHQ